MNVTQAKRCIAAGFASFGLAVLTATPSRAQSTFTLVGTGNSDTMNISYNGGASYEDGYVGEYTGSLNGTTTNVFCTDISNDINVGQSYAANTSSMVTDAAGALSGGYYSGGLASAMNANDYGALFPSGSLTASQRASEVAWLADTYLGATASTFASGASGSTSLNDNMAGVSLSIWDIVQDGGDGLNKGSVVTESSTQAAMGGLVSYYEAQASAHSNFSSDVVEWIQAPRSADGSHAQDFLAVVPNVVAAPEPSVWMTGLTLAGGIGGAMFRGRRRVRA